MPRLRHEFSPVLLVARLRAAEREVARVRRDFDAFVQRAELRMAEYDKERSLAGRLVWPVVIALLTAAAIGVFALLLKVNGVIGPS